MDLNRKIINNIGDGSSRSNAYTQLASQRQPADRNRQVIGGFRRPNVAVSYRSDSKTEPSGEVKEQRTGLQSRPTLQEQNSYNVAEPRHFSEPSSQKYNPYV